MSRTRGRAPGGKVLTDQFQTVRVVLASDWCRKTFFLPNHRAARLGVVSCSLTRKIHTGQLLAIFVWVVLMIRRSWVYSRRKVPVTAENIEKIVRHIPKKLAGDTLDLGRYHNISVFKRLRVFVHPLMSISFSAFRNFAFLDEMGFFFPYTKFLISLAVTETFPTLSSLSSHGPGSYVKHRIGGVQHDFLCVPK